MQRAVWHGMDLYVRESCAYPDSVEEVDCPEVGRDMNDPRHETERAIEPLDVTEGARRSARVGTTGRCCSCRGGFARLQEPGIAPRHMIARAERGRTQAVAPSSSRVESIGSRLPASWRVTSRVRSGVR